MIIIVIVLVFIFFLDHVVRSQIPVLERKHLVLQDSQGPVEFLLLGTVKSLDLFPLLVESMSELLGSRVLCSRPRGGQERGRLFLDRVVRRVERCRRE
jgi:hypothetical protein